MEELGFKSPSEYFRHKMRPEGKQIELFPTGKDVQKEVKLAQLEMQISQLARENEILKNSSNEGLGKVDILVREGIEKELKEREFLELKDTIRRLKFKLKNKQEELDTVNAENLGMKEKLKMKQVVEDVSPMVTPVLSAIGKGIQGMKNGGGLAGFLAGLESSDSSTKLSPEDEKALAMGKDITGLFNDEEQQLLFTIMAVLSQQKSYLPMIIQFLQVSANPKPGAHHEATVDATDEGEGGVDHTDETLKDLGI
jgi:hypothetical protein